MSEATCAGRRFALRSTPEQPANSKQNRACRFKLRTIMVSVKGQPGSERGWAKRGLRGCLIFRSDVIINLRGYKKHMYASTLDSPGFIRGQPVTGKGDLSVVTPRGQPHQWEHWWHQTQTWIHWRLERGCSQSHYWILYVLRYLFGDDLRLA